MRTEMVWKRKVWDTPEMVWRKKKIESGQTPLPEVGGIGAWQGMYTLWTTLILG